MLEWFSFLFACVVFFYAVHLKSQSRRLAFHTTRTGAWRDFEERVASGLEAELSLLQLGFIC